MSSEARFKLTLTPKGKKARAQGAREFRGYQPDSDTMSRDPLQIERVFDEQPKPFPAGFWRVYAVDTLLGYWMPTAIADAVDGVLSKHIEPYMLAIQQRTSPRNMEKIVRQLDGDVKNLKSYGWIEENVSAVKNWRDRVVRFRSDHDLIALRIHQFQRVPDLLSTETRGVVLATVETLRNHLVTKKKLSPVRFAINEFIEGKITRTQLDKRWVELKRDAITAIKNHAERASGKYSS